MREIDRRYMVNSLVREAPFNTAHNFVVFRFGLDECATCRAPRGLHPCDKNGQPVKTE